MQKLTAIFRFKRNESPGSIVRKYKTKTAFAEDLRGSGMRVIAVLTDEDIAAYKEMSEFDAIQKKGQAEIIREYCLQVL